MTDILKPDDLQAITDAIVETLGDNIAAPRVYQLGKQWPDGRREVKRRDSRARRGEVWVRLPGQDVGAAVPAVNTALSDDELVFGNFVEVKKQNKRLRIVGPAVESAEYLARVPIAPQRLISPSQFNYGLLLPKSPAVMLATVTAAFRLIDQTQYYQPPIDTKDFTADRPSAGLAIGVFIEIDPVDSTLYYFNSATFSDTLTLLAAFQSGAVKSTVTSGRFPVGWVKLFNNQTGISRAEILPAAGLIAAGSGGTQAAGLYSSYLVNTQIVTTSGDYVVSGV